MTVFASVSANIYVSLGLILLDVGPYQMAWKSGKLVASLRMRRAFWTLSRESLLNERAKKGTNRWSCNAAASCSCKQGKNKKALIIGLH